MIAPRAALVCSGVCVVSVCLRFEKRDGIWTLDVRTSREYCCKWRQVSDDISGGKKERRKRLLLLSAAAAAAAVCVCLFCYPYHYPYRWGYGGYGKAKHDTRREEILTR